MLHIKTILKMSPIHGIGVFTDEQVKKGSIVWTFIPWFDQRLLPEQVRLLPQQAQDFLDLYGFDSWSVVGAIVFSPDNSRFTNHSKNPNCLNEKVFGQEETVTIAAKDIAIGEELTEDYEVLCPGFNADIYTDPNTAKEASNLSAKMSEDIEQTTRRLAEMMAINAPKQRQRTTKGRKKGR